MKEKKRKKTTGVHTDAAYIGVNGKPIFHEKHRQTFVESHCIICCNVILRFVLSHNVLRTNERDTMVKAVPGLT